MDQPYGDAIAAEESQLRQQNPGMSQNQVAFQGDEAGHAAAVATVEELTGCTSTTRRDQPGRVPRLANVLNGVQVCLGHPMAYDLTRASTPTGPGISI